MIDAAQSLGLWIPQVTGRYINEDWNPENQGFGAQCWDAAANWSRYLGLPVISTRGEGRWPGWAGNMVDAFPQSPEIAAAYELIGPDEPGQPGDIAVWGDGYYYYPKTHVAVLVRDLGAQLLCVSQNSSASLPGNPYPEWTSGPTILQHLPRRGLIGFIRPRPGGLTPQGTTTPLSEEDDMPTPEDLWKHKLTLDGKEFEAGDILVYARKNAEGAKNNAETAAVKSTAALSAAQAAPGLAVQVLLNTKLPAPDGSGKEYTVADYLVFGWWYAMQAKDKPQGQPMDLTELNKAINESVANIVPQLEITVKETPNG